MGTTLLTFPTAGRNKSLGLSHDHRLCERVAVSKPSRHCLSSISPQNMNIVVESTYLPILLLMHSAKEEEF